MMSKRFLEIASKEHLNRLLFIYNGKVDINGNKMTRLLLMRYIICKCIFDIEYRNEIIRKYGFDENKLLNIIHSIKIDKVKLDIFMTLKFKDKKPINKNMSFNLFDDEIFYDSKEQFE